MAAKHPTKKATRAYIAWRHMRERCLNPNHFAYPRYGARGIHICKEWLASFNAFLADMGDPPKGMTLDRIDNSAGYSKDNCRWASRKTQARNTRQATVVTWNGDLVSLADLCESYQVSARMVRKRIAKGWPLADAILCPAKPGASFQYRASPTTATPVRPN